jgi:hypothetical protein
MESVPPSNGCSKEPDDYQFCAPVKDVKESELGGIPVWKFRGTVMRLHDGSQEFHIDIYATREAMRDGVAPVLGDEFPGSYGLELRGTPADPKRRCSEIAHLPE